MKNGEVIKQMRLQAGVKAIQLAQMLGVSRSYISQVESGLSPASDSLLNKVCLALGMTESEKSEEQGQERSTIPLTRLSDELAGVKKELNLLREQLSDVQALLVKLLAK